ncbi:hypothetical protein QTJ16_004142 [Diplocarpon rosae]|uniref:C2H2-type domain-containing protein n=1 Tax=Diplocarpon rosae TaxID=946125 RepID=A0AAD9T0N2_9HELO|nr:hypothetical protein QTJ16_004142 [Diplocarpon rosae]
MEDDSSPQSSLSDLDTTEFDSEDPEQGTAPEMPPAKRQKLEESYTTSLVKSEDVMSISSDSSGEVPNSPSNRWEDDDIHEQVTTCTWRGCHAGDLGNMDKLVEHIHNEHIETRGKHYVCEWADCVRIDKTHASAYALKAHMRSHTREKPFYCTLPECDRAFTRSDALAKHHRTVHETEALRPSDPIPKSMSAAQKSQRMKMNNKGERTQSEGNIPGLSNENGSANGHTPLGAPVWTSSYPAELGFTAEEEARGPKELYYLLRKQIGWAEEEAEKLKVHGEAMEEMRKNEWLEKEILLDHVQDVDVDWHQRRRMVLAGAVELPSADMIKAAALKADTSAGSPRGGMIMPSSPSPMVQPVENQRDAAQLLVDMHQD